MPLAISICYCLWLKEILWDLRGPNHNEKGFFENVKVCNGQNIIDIILSCNSMHLVHWNYISLIAMLYTDNISGAQTRNFVDLELVGTWDTKFICFIHCQGH